MHEVIKKSIEEFDKRFPFAIIDWKLSEKNDGDGVTTNKMTEIKQYLIHSHITLAEEKIKELEGEKKKGKGSIEINGRRVDVKLHTNIEVGYNQAKQEEINKWKQVISKLK